MIAAMLSGGERPGNRASPETARHFGMVPSTINAGK
jgi:hypothetical protein